MPFESRMTLSLMIVALLCIDQSTTLADLTRDDEDHLENVERHRSSAKRNDQEIKGYAFRPDDLTLQKLEVSWQPLELDSLSNRCIIRGQMFLPATPSSEHNSPDQCC